MSSRGPCGADPKQDTLTVDRRQAPRCAAMIALASFVTPPGRCEYLHEQTSQMQYDFVLEATAAEYEQRLNQGWRRFGRTFFRPRCASCQACQSVRVLAAAFAPDRSQRRNAKLNGGEVRLQIGPPTVS